LTLIGSVHYAYLRRKRCEVIAAWRMDCGFLYWATGWDVVGRGKVARSAKSDDKKEGLAL